MKLDAASIEAYLAGMPPERRQPIEAVRALILKNLPKGYVEAFNWGMISYEVPLETSGKTYNGKPLMYAALANQKNHMGLYLCGLYAIPGLDKTFTEDVRNAGKKLDMGKACVRFRRLDDLHLPAVAKSIRSVKPMDLVEASNNAPRKKR